MTTRITFRLRGVRPSCSTQARSLDACVNAGGRAQSKFRTIFASAVQRAGFSSSTDMQRKILHECSNIKFVNPYFFLDCWKVVGVYRDSWAELIQNVVPAHGGATVRKVLFSKFRWCSSSNKRQNASRFESSDKRDGASTRCSIKASCSNDDRTA
jgi:hypothetical protein